MLGIKSDILRISHNGLIIARTRKGYVQPADTFSFSQGRDAVDHLFMPENRKPDYINISAIS
jgi:hypothetical protein